MNQLAVNPRTGYLESPNGVSGRNFDSAKKIQFLELAKKHIDETGRFPKVTALCNVVGIGHYTLETHLKKDAIFAQDYREILLRGRAELEHVMFENGCKPQGFMDRMAWLRANFPETYDRQNVVTVKHELGFVESVSKKINEYVDVTDFEVSGENASLSTSGQSDQNNNTQFIQQNENK